MQSAVLEVKYNFGTIYHAIFQDADNLVLIDAGCPYSLDLLQHAANEKGIDLSKLSLIIITHHDWDHIGGLRDLKNEYPQAKIASSHIEAGYINGSRQPLRLRLAEEKAKLMPDDSTEELTIVRNKYKFVKPVDVDILLDDNELLGICGGLRILYTPGHMAGHISVYAEETKELVTGDAMVARDGQLVGPDPQYTLDMSLAMKSIGEMKRLDIEKIICYHGGVISKDANKMLHEL